MQTSDRLALPLVLSLLLVSATPAAAGLLDEVVAAESAPAYAAEDPATRIERELPAGGFGFIPERKSLGLFLTAQALVIMDMGQTLSIRDHPELEEANPIFGREPSPGRVYAVFGTRLALNTLAYWLLPDRWANTVSMLNVVVGIPVVARNASLGLSFRF